jgi:hypothetical protein
MIVTFVSEVYVLEMMMAQSEGALQEIVPIFL